MTRFRLIIDHCTDHLECTAARIKRSDERLTQGHRSIPATAVPPLFKEVSLIEMPLAHSGSFVVVESEVHRKRHLADQILPRFPDGGSVVDRIDPDQQQCLYFPLADAIGETLKIIDMSRSLTMGDLCVAEGLPHRSQGDIHGVNQGMNFRGLPVPRHQQAGTLVRLEVGSHLLDSIIGRWRCRSDRRSHIRG